MNWYVGDKIVRCHCGTILHVERKRYCCKIDWLSRYPILMANRTRELEERESKIQAFKINEEIQETDPEPEIIIVEQPEINVVTIDDDSIPRKKNGRKVRKDKRPSRKLTQEMRKSVLDRDGHKCVRCGNHEKLHVHHIWHHKFGGGEDMGNLETLCLRCHIKEHENEPIAKVMRKSL